MREDGHEVGQRRQLDKAADKGVESSGGAQVDTSQDGDDAPAGEGRVERVVESAVDATHPFGEGSRAVAGESPQGTAGSDVAARGRDQGWQEGDDQEAKGTPTGAGGLVVDLRQGEVVGAGGDAVEILNRIEDGNHVQNTGDETDGHLSQHRLGDVTAGLGNLFGQVGRAVGGAHTVGAVEHAHDEDESLRGVPGSIAPCLPDILVGHVPITIDVRHDGADNDGDEHPRQDEKHTEVSDIRQPAVHEQDNGTADPSTDQEPDKDIPGLGNEARVHQGVHGHRLLGHDQTHGGRTEDPCQTIPPAGKEAAGSSILSRRHRRPVVDTTRRGHARCQLGNGSRH